MSLEPAKSGVSFPDPSLANEAFTMAASRSVSASGRQRVPADLSIVLDGRKAGFSGALCEMLQRAVDRGTLSLRDALFAFHDCSVFVTRVWVRAGRDEFAANIEDTGEPAATATFQSALQTVLAQPYEGILSECVSDPQCALKVTSLDKLRALVDEYLLPVIKAWEPGRVSANAPVVTHAVPSHSRPARPTHGQGVDPLPARRALSSGVNRLLTENPLPSGITPEFYRDYLKHLQVLSDTGRLNPAIAGRIAAIFCRYITRQIEALSTADSTTATAAIVKRLEQKIFAEAETTLGSFLKEMQQSEPEIQYRVHRQFLLDHFYVRWAVPQARLQGSWNPIVDMLIVPTSAPVGAQWRRMWEWIASRTDLGEDEENGDGRTETIRPGRYSRGLAVECGRVVGDLLEFHAERNQELLGCSDSVEQGAEFIMNLVLRDPRGSTLEFLRNQYRPEDLHFSRSWSRLHSTLFAWAYSEGLIPNYDPLVKGLIPPGMTFQHSLIEEVAVRLTVEADGVDWTGKRNASARMNLAVQFCEHLLESDLAKEIQAAGTAKDAEERGAVLDLVLRSGGDIGAEIELFGKRLAAKGMKGPAVHRAKLFLRESFLPGEPMRAQTPPTPPTPSAPSVEEPPTSAETQQVQDPPLNLRGRRVIPRYEQFVEKRAAAASLLVSDLLIAREDAVRLTEQDLCLARGNPPHILLRREDSPRCEAILLSATQARVLENYLTLARGVADGDTGMVSDHPLSVPLLRIPSDGGTGAPRALTVAELAKILSPGESTSS